MANIKGNKAIDSLIILEYNQNSILKSSRYEQKNRTILYRMESQS